MTGLSSSAGKPIPLTQTGVDREARLRADDAWLQKAWADPKTRVIVVEDSQALMRTGDGAAELIFVEPSLAPDGIRFFLGLDPDDIAYFGVIGTPPEPGGGSGLGDNAEIKRAGLREAGHLMADRDAGLLTHAIALANWHAVSHFCSRCGSPTEPIMSGHARKCTSDGSEHFPRCDPAVIMLVADPDDRCLLARNAAWPERRVSILAGFVEPGESAEQAVAREVLEEVGLVITGLSYSGSQPWPMPHNIMLGYRAEVTDSEIKVDADEIAEAAWYTRDELRATIESGELLMPPSPSISRWLIETWYGGPLPRAPKPPSA